MSTPHGALTGLPPLALDERGVVIDAETLGDLSRLPRVEGLCGHFALWSSEGGVHRLVRDTLGVHKLFWALRADGGLDASNFLVDLVRAGHAPREIWSVPMGHAITIRPGERSFALDRWSELTFNEDEDEPLDTLPRHVERIGEALDRTFRALAQVFAERRVVVTLSGGLDSTVIATLAREHFPELSAVTFALDEGELTARAGADLHYARLVATELGIALEEVRVTPDEVAALVDDVLLHGQDWRGFNVHCGLVNAALGAHLAREARHDDAPPVILTGDTMNELVADYTPVTYEGVEHYALPDLSPGKLRRFLVNGLDSGDREVGIFHRHGVRCVQPYALCAEAYAALPPEVIERDEAKQTLVRELMGERIPEPIYTRPKTRAQIGHDSEVGGTLAVLEDRGMTQEWLFDRFAGLFDMDARALRGLIRAGFYRFPTRYPDPR
jgi:asparagine synthetase B (glutamine-hydrolysing)